VADKNIRTTATEPISTNSGVCKNWWKISGAKKKKKKPGCLILNPGERRSPHYFPMLEGGLHGVGGSDSTKLCAHGVLEENMGRTRMVISSLLSTNGTGKGRPRAQSKSVLVPFVLPF